MTLASPATPPRTLGEFLLFHRNRKGVELTQADLCDLIGEDTGLRQPHYSAMEKDERAPNQLQALAIAKELRLTPAERATFVSLIVKLQRRLLARHRTSHGRPTAHAA